MSKYLIAGARGNGTTFALPLAHPGELRSLYGCALNVFIALCLHATEDGIADMTLAEISSVTGVGRTTVHASLAQLASMQRIQIVEQVFTRRTRISQSMRWQVFKRDRYRCVYCGTDDGPFEADHWIPAAWGGSDSIDNLVTACPKCNRKKWVFDI